MKMTMVMNNKTQIIIAGHGGQGVLELANCISYYELLKGRHVAQTPSYGPESRGGKVKCYVVISDAEIDSPIVEEPDYLIVMNIPSMDYVSLLRNGGTLLMNSSLISHVPLRKDIITFEIPATGIADNLKGSLSQSINDTRIAANSVMFGSYLAITDQHLDLELVKEVFNHFLLERKAAYIELDIISVQRGYEFAKKETANTGTTKMSLIPT